MKDAKVKIEKLNKPKHVAMNADGSPCYADACYVRGTEMMGYRECKTPRRRVMGYPKRFWRHLFNLFWWRVKKVGPQLCACGYKPSAFQGRSPGTDWVTYYQCRREPCIMCGPCFTLEQWNALDIKEESLRRTTTSLDKALEKLCRADARRG